MRRSSARLLASPAFSSRNGHGQNGYWNGVVSFFSGGHDSPAPAAPCLYNSVLGALGNAPVIRLRHIAPEGVDVFVKCEAFNPMLSVKDRLAVGLLEWAELHGKIAEGQTVVDVVSGHTGVGLAVACKQRGFPLVMVCSKDCTVEWQQMMRLLGAKVIACSEPAEIARSLSKRKGWFLTNDFKSAGALWIHANKTGPDILAALGSRSLDVFVAPHGSGATLQGVGQVLREQSPKTKICVVEPDSLPHPEYTSMYGAHKSWPEHLLKGWTTDFAPKALCPELRANYVDEVVNVTGHESLEVAQQLAQEECIFTGISGGALAAGALKIAKDLPRGSSVLTVLLDTSHFHLSTPLLRGVSEEMTEEETELLQAADVGSSSKSNHLQW